MNIIKRLKRAAWLSFETFVDAIMARGLGVYSYPPASPEPVRAPPAVKSAWYKRLLGCPVRSPG